MSGIWKRVGDRIDMQKFWQGRLGKKRPFERPKSRGENNIKIGFKETRLRALEQIRVSQDRVNWWAVVTNTVMTPWTQKAGRNFFPSIYCNTITTAEKLLASYE